MEVERVVIAIGDPFRLVLVLHFVRMAPEMTVRRKLRQWRLEPRDALQEAQRRRRAPRCVQVA